MKEIVYSFYVLLLSFWVGGMSMYTFVVTPILFKSFPRDKAGEIVGYLFPYYFTINSIISVFCLLIYMFSLSQPLKKVHSIVLAMLVLALCLNMLNSIVIHPVTKKVKAKIHSFDKQSENSSEQIVFKQKFRKLHMFSAIFNLIVLLEGIALVFISTHLLRLE